MNGYDIYDIDGTLTKSGHDLWYLTTKSMVQDKNQFENDILNEKNKNLNLNPWCKLTTWDHIIQNACQP